jgi:hypothetical protein
MKKLIIAMFVIFCFAAVSFADDIPLKATWHAPTTSQGGGPLNDLRGFNIYRTDGTRVKVNVAEIATDVCLPAGSGLCTYLFNLNVPVNSAGTATFVIRSVDTNNNEAADSNAASFSWNVDTIPPSVIGDFGVSRQ